MYAWRRLLLAPVFMLGAATVVFFVMRILPGDPAIALLGDDVSAGAVEAFRVRAGLDVPVAQQYLDMLRRIVTLDLGVSLQTGTSVAQRIVESFPFTVQLVAAASLIGITVGVTLGLAAAFRRGTAIDSVVSMWVGVIGGTPSYVMGIILMLIFAVGLAWTPVLSVGTDDLWSTEALSSLALPAIALGLAETAPIARITRAAATDLMSSSLFVTALRGRGVRERRIRYVHVLRNSLVPVMAVASAQVASTIAGSVLLETIFSRPGIGRLLIEGLRQRDFPIVESTLLIFSGLVVLVGLASDLLQAVVDPRVSYR